MHNILNIFDNISNKMYQRAKEISRVNPSYLTKSQNIIESIKSTEFDKSNNKKRYSQKNTIQPSEQRTNKYLQVTNSANKTHKMETSKILFAPIWKTKAEIFPSDKHSEQLVDLFMKKNEQIAASLMKQKKSMSDYVYTNQKNKKMSRYLEMKSDQVKKQTKDIRKEDSRNSNLPKIGRVVIIQHEIEQIDHRDSQKELSLENQDYESEPNTHQPEYTKITNINIQRFLKLKQQAYNLKTIEQEKVKAKKKLHNHQKKVARKKKQRIKNSLEDFLEAKIIPKQNDYQSLRATSKNEKNEHVIKILQKMRDKKSIETPTVPVQPTISTEIEELKKVSPKKKIKIGLNTKISQKQLFFDGQTTLYDTKMKQYREFLFLVNLAHNYFDPLVVEDLGSKNEIKYKYYIGKGNNKQLIKALMKRRFWWVQVDNPMQANFVWTQLKNNNFYTLQSPAERNYENFYEKPKQRVTKLKQKQKSQINSKKMSVFKAPLPKVSNEKILTSEQEETYENFLKQIGSFNNVDRFSNFDNRLKYFPSLIKSSRQDLEMKKVNTRLHNHLQNNFYIGNKKALFYNLKKYYELTNKDIFSIVPYTFHIGEAGIKDPAYQQFIGYYRENKTNSRYNLWIVKPGQNSNRGNGITVCKDLKEINKQLRGKKKNKEYPNTFIIQKYIQRPLLYKGRKFDIRHYMLATKLHGKIRLYWYSEGYVRTSSRQFDLEQIQDVQIHLTNDAIQQYATNYGKFEQGNKISYSELQKYIDATFPNRKYSLSKQLYPRMRSISLDAFKAAYLSMDPHNLQHNFQIFGLDFMIDSHFNVWLIEVNTNPCLEISAAILRRIIPTMLEHSFRLTIDPLFPPPKHYPNTVKHYVPDNPLERMQFELVFDEGRDGMQIEQLFRNVDKNTELQDLEEDQDTFENEGKQGDFDIQ